MGRRNNGEGTIYLNSSSTKKSNKYTGLLKIGINPNGKPKMKRFFGETKSEVYSKMKNYKASQSFPIESEKFKDVFDLMFEERKTIKQLRPKSIQMYETINDNIFKQYFSEYQLKNISNEYVNTIFKELEEKYSYSYLTKIRNIGSLVYKYAKKSASEIINPFENVFIINEDKDKPRRANYFTNEEMQRLIQSQDKNVRYPHILSILWNTGLRINELLALTIADLDFENEIIDVNKTLIEHKNSEGKWIIESQNMPKTKDSFRKVPMLSTTCDYLEASILTTKHNPNPKGLVFTTSTGNYVSSRNVLRTFNQTLKHSGIAKNGRSLHSIRHTATSMFIDISLSSAKNENERELATADVKKILGHRNLDISAYVYDNDQIANAQRFAEKYKAVQAANIKKYSIGEMLTFDNLFDIYLSEGYQLLDEKIHANERDLFIEYIRWKAKHQSLLSTCPHDIANNTDAIHNHPDYHQEFDKFELSEDEYTFFKTHLHLLRGDKNEIIC